MKTTTKERIMLIISALGVSVRQFELTAKISNGYINNLKSEPSSKIMQRILSAFPQINSVYLLSGEGEMFVTPNNIAIATDNGHAVAGNHSVINQNQDEQRKQLEELQKQLDEYDRSIAILEARLAEKDAMIKQILEAMASGKQ